MAATESLPALPFERSNLIDPAPLLLHLQSSAPIGRVRTPVGDVAWLVTGYDNVRNLLDDRRLGRTHPDPEHAPLYTRSAFGSAPRGDHETEPEDHARSRRLVTRSFMVKRMNALRPAIQTLVDDLLDRLAAGTPPGDLHESLSTPLPVLVICELLGVPYEDRTDFRRWSDDSIHMWDAERATAGYEGLYGYMLALSARKREHRGEDVISDWVTASESGEDWLTEQRIAELGAGLLFAGHETTMSQLDLGALLLLTHPDQRRDLERDPGLITSAVEEIMRIGNLGQALISRYARADIDVAGETIRAGELVLLAISAANRDDGAFPEPERFDIRREQNAHVGFGHGYRFCLGAGLARVELQIGLGALVRRFPTMELAVPMSDLQGREEALTGGLRALPVTW
jgi:pentalenolactone synthase